MFAADGMRPDLVQKYADAKVMPTMRDLIKKGVQGQNGMLQGFPPNTGVGWHTMATGTWPGEHGSTNNTFHRDRRGRLQQPDGFATNGILQADTIAQAAERAGQKVVAMEWVGARNLRAGAAGAGGRLPHLLLEPRRAAATTTCPGSPASRTASAFPTSGSTSTTRRAGRTSRPPTARPKQETLTVTNTAFPATDNVTRTYDLYIYDSTNDGETSYDRVLSRAVDRRARTAHSRPRRPQAAATGRT